MGLAEMDHAAVWPAFMDLIVDLFVMPDVMLLGVTRRAGPVWPVMLECMEISATTPVLEELGHQPALEMECARMD